MAIQKWSLVDEVEDAARKHRVIKEIVSEDIDTYHKVLTDISKELEPEAVPCVEQWK